MGNDYTYDTMPEAKKVFEAMKRKSKREREEFIFFRKRKETYKYWLSWWVNSKIKYEIMEEKDFNAVLEYVTNMLYDIFGDMYDVNNILENTDFLNEVVEDIVCTADVVFNNDDIEIAVKRVIKNHLLNET